MDCPDNEPPACSRASLSLPGPPRLSLTAPATAQNATVLRRAFHRWIKTLVRDDDADDLTVAVYEALANAAEHAFTGQYTPGSLWLHATVGDNQITITITDNGTWRAGDTMPDYRGRGLPLIHQLTTAAHIELGPQGTTVRLRHELAPQHTDPPSQ
jgi:serine/threonine-protein kinase RsbW